MKTVFKTALLAIIISAAFCGLAVAQEEPAAPISDQMFFVLAKPDVANGIFTVWWTNEMWAVLSWQDKSSDAILGYNVMSRMLKDHYFFSPLAVDMESTNQIALDGTPVLENDKGLSVSPVKVHKSIMEAMPNLMAFPKKTADGKDLVATGTTSLTVKAKFGGASSESSFTWALPLQYPPAAAEAMQFVRNSQAKPVGEMTEEDLLSAYLPSTMSADITTGFLATIIPKELFKLMIEKDPAILENKLMKELADGLVDSRSFIALTSFDQKSERIAEAAKNATAIDSTGKTVLLDVETYKSFLAGRNKKQEAFEILIFPQLGDTGKISLLFKDPDTGKEVRFDWNLDK